MLKIAIIQLKIAVYLLISFTILTGIVYPLLITGIAQLFFPNKANGSLMEQNGKVIGSQLIGQSFSDPRYFWGRPSATNPFPNNAQASKGSNMGPTNPDFLSTVKERTKQMIFESNSLVPVDLVTASGSGLDPDISPLAALYQVPRIAKLRKLKEKDLQDLIQNLIQPRTLGILGEPRVNVLMLNLALDKLNPNAETEKNM